MKTRLLLGLIAPLLLSGTVVSASAQTISSVLLNDSHSGPAWNAWDSIYGSDLPVSVFYTLTVFVDYVCNTSGIDTHICTTNLEATSPTVEETYWYASSTQINFYATPYPPFSDTTPEAGCLVYEGQEVCNNTEVCDGICTNNFFVEYSGTP
jgi:hypothetical protein